MEELRNSQSYIDAYAKYIKTGKDKEIRALLTANAIALEGTTQIPVPEFVYDTVKTAWEDSELLRYVRKLYVKGNLKVGFEISSSGAEVHPEGGDPIQEEQLQIGVVELVPEMIKKYVMLSDELEAMASRDFLMYVYDELTHQIALKLETEIINAITNQPVGATVPEVVNYGTNPKPETIAMTLSKLTAEAKNPVAIMNRGTWGEFKKAQYDAKYPIDVFEKLTVIFSDALSSFADAQVNEPYLIVGDFENGFLMNYPEGDEIRIKRDDITLATQDLVRYVGRVYCAMGVIAPRHFVTVNKGNEVTPIVPTGNIEITENGENINVAPFATATVNVAGGGGGDNIILPMTEVTWDGTGDGGQLYLDPDTSKVIDNEQVIIRLNVIDEETSEFILLGTYDATVGPTMEDFSGITDGDPAVNIALRHNTERPDEPWYLVVSVGGEPIGGTYQVGVCRDIPHEVA